VIILGGTTPKMSRKSFGMWWPGTEVEAQPLRPVFVGYVIPILVRLAAMSSHGSARHGPPLAPQSFCLALEQEIATPSWKARNSGEPS